MAGNGFLHGVEVNEISNGLRPIEQVSSSIIGIVGTAPGADPMAFPLNTPVLVAGSRYEAAKLDVTEDGTGGGTLPPALDGIFDQIGATVVVIRVQEEIIENDTLTNVIGGTDADTGQYLGIQALLSSKSVNGKVPRILCAPGFTHQKPVDGDGNPSANPVVAELIAIAERMSAIIVADGPNTNDDAAVQYGADFGSERVYVIDPWVKVFKAGETVIEPASARVAGVIAKTDYNIGFHQSPSNQPINGIIGTARAIDFELGDENSRANLLNEQKIATIIYEDGYRLWGNLSLSGDPKWKYLCVRRTADVINDATKQSHFWAIDRGITTTLVSDVVEGINAELRAMKNRGQIIGGSCWANADLNTPESIQSGRLYIDYDFTPPYPNERMTFRSMLVNGYAVEVIV
ncbi:phage tail sheath subtilisin-like domain-containing protein [Marinomonas gallaica]|uniref:phage tail sheath subtilisin-like domain-containing protein n=1 Tax=Marinomonas gallaica TaxID=1806667 RepID=UPI003CE584FE